MPLPELIASGDLPVGVHAAPMAEVVSRFGRGSSQRRSVTARLRRIHGLAQATGCLDRFIIFGSYVTGKPDPNDVDTVLIMRDDFDVAACTGETRKLFDHQQAAGAFGASIFWTRPGLLI